MKISSSAPKKTKRAIIDILKQEGALDAGSLGDRLSVSGMAIRQHLYALEKEGLVTYKEEARAQGRPAKMWRLTPQADRFFPNGYADLTLSLINSISEAFGDEGLERLLDVRTKQQKESYQGQISKKSSLKKRIEALAELRTNEGYMAEIEQKKDGSWLLIENHCPICAAAAACTGLCARELELFKIVLGEEVEIKRTEHIIAGDRRCAYQIRGIDKK